MPNKSNVINSDALGSIDIGSTGFKDDSSVRAAIEGGKAYKQIIQGIDKELSSMMKDMTSYTNDSNKALDEMIKKISDAGKGYKEAFSNSLLFKKAKEDILTLTRATNEYNKAVEDQSISDDQLFELYKKVSIAYQESSDALDALTTATYGQNDSVTDLRANLKVLYSEVKDGSKSFSSEFKTIEKGIKDSTKAADSLNKRVTNFARDLSGALTSLKSMFSLEELTKGIGPSAEMQVQTQLQQRYGLNNRQFNSFKNNLYGTFNNSLYSSEAVIQTMQSLNSMGLRNQEEVLKYFDKILEGQQVLGMSAESQTALMQLSYKTGRDELTLGTNTYAKYLKEIDNVSKEQLNQLISINTHFASQMADLGVYGDAFDSTHSAVTGALVKAFGDTKIADTYNQLISSYATSTDLAAETLGMSSGQYKSFIMNGGDTTELLMNNNGRAGQYYRDLMKYGFEYQDEFSQGLDSSTKSFIDTLVRLQQQGSFSKEMVDKFKGLDGAQINEELKDIYEGNLTEAEKQKNFLENQFKNIIDWKLDAEIKNSTTLITNWLAVIASLVGLIGKAQGISLLSSAKNFLGSPGTAMMSGTGALNTLAGLGFSAGATSSVGATLLGAGMVGIPLLGVGLAGYDAYQGYKSGGASGAARQFFMGDAYKGNNDNFGSVGKNVGKWAAIGAGVGTFFGPGVGTAIGAGVGALAGLGLGLWGSSMDKTVKEQEKTNEKLDKVVSNTAKSANALTIRELGRNVTSVIPYSKVAAGSPARAMGGPTGIGGTSGLKYGVSSPYGSRSFDGWHYGVDFSGGSINGAPLYSNVTGTVVDVGQDPDGANFVGVKGSDGYIHYYWHMIAPSTRKVGESVKQGDLVGYVGSTGNSTGPHLHYQVTRSRYSDGYNAFLSNSVNPESFATNAIFSGSAAPYNPDYDSMTSSSSSSVSSSSLLSMNKQSSNIKFATFGGTRGVGGVIDSITDLKNTIVKLSDRTDANEKLMRAITSTYNTQPRTS